ncbi:hypothetical protein LXL04_009461 [Taraxacum kok-saghyz]
MEERMGRSAARLEDIPVLIHRIQLRLPVKEAARTSILSKSWSHAWSTIPILKFHQAAQSLTKEQKTEHLESVDRTLIRYLRDNIPIKRIFLKIDIKNKNSVDKWIQRLTTTITYPYKFSLIIVISGSTSLPDEILSGKNIINLNVSSSFSKIPSLLKTAHPVINCVSLRKLQLKCVQVNEKVLHDILSTCSLLVGIEVLYCKGLNNIKVKNLHRLRDLTVVLYEPNLYRLGIDSKTLEIDDVPNLGFFKCRGIPLSFNDYSFRVTGLGLGDHLGMDYTYLDMIVLKFPLLRNLTLYLRSWISESFHFTCASMTTLSLMRCPKSLISVQINAPKLVYFWFEGTTMPSLVFPAVVNNSLLKRIQVEMSLSHPVDASFFLKMSQALALSIKCEIEITAMNMSVILPPFDIDIENLRKKVMYPAMNVQKLSFKTNGDEGMWDHSPFFDALFSICHPKCVVAIPDEKYKHHNHFLKLMESKVVKKKKKRKDMEYLNWPYYLKSFEIKPETCRSLYGSALVSVFKLNWR